MDREPAVAYLELTNSDKFAIVDAIYEDDLIALGPWRLCPYGYAVACGGNQYGRFPLQNLVMQIFGHDLAGVTVDHRNHNRLDNRRGNLRLATERQQQMNRGRHRSNTSGYIGVSWAKFERQWKAYTYFNGKQKHLGYFTNPIEAARARDAAILAGPDAEFAVLNFPLDNAA